MQYHNIIIDKQKTMGVQPMIPLVLLMKYHEATYKNDPAFKARASFAENDQE